MTSLRILTMTAVLMAVSTAAAAFQEQQGSGAATATQKAPAAVDSTSKAGFTTGPSTTSGTVGTEVRIPGLGKLGVLPKMDFGLELLYGAAAEPKADAVRPDATDEGDLRIRGTVKHRF